MAPNLLPGPLPSAISAVWLHPYLMKTLILTLLTAGLTTVSFGQKAFILSYQNKKGFLALSAGGSAPVGHFASRSSVDKRAGMADWGTAYNVSAGYRLAGQVGLMVRGERHQNPLQPGALVNAFYPNNTDSWTASAGNWTVTTLMGGPYVTFPMNRFSLDTRLLAGRAVAVLPATSLTGTFVEKRMMVQTTGAQSQAWAYGGGVTLRYRLSRSFALHVNGDYTQSAMRFDNLSSDVRSGSDDTSQRTTFSSDRLISTVSASAGISILFGNSLRPF